MCRSSFSVGLGLTDILRCKLLPYWSDIEESDEFFLDIYFPHRTGLVNYQNYAGTME